MKHLIKNKYVIFGSILLLLLFGMARLDLASFLSSSDFTLTNMQVSGDNIIMSGIETFYASPRWVDISPSNTFPITTTPSSTAYYYKGSDYGSKFCEALGETKLSYTYSYYDSSRSGFEWTGSAWRSVSYTGGNYIDSVTCLSSDLENSGFIEQKTPITTTEKYNHFELNYKINFGTDKPYLLIGEKKEYFVNGVIETNDVLSGTDLKVGFESDLSETSIDNSIELLGSYQLDSSDSSSNDKKTPLSLLTSLSAKNSENPYASNDNFLVNLFYNTGTIISAIFIDWWAY